MEVKVSVNGTDIPYSYDGRYYIRNVSSDEADEDEEGLIAWILSCGKNLREK